MADISGVNVAKAYLPIVLYVFFNWQLYWSVAGVLKRAVYRGADGLERVAFRKETIVLDSNRAIWVDICS